MKQSIFNSQSSLRFKRFSNKGYALFACLGRVVLVGVLTVPTLSHAKAGTLTTRVEAAADTLSRKEMKLDEVVVTGSRAPLTALQSAKIVKVITADDIHRAAVETVNDVLKLATGVDVRQRGGFGVQTDISVRGGNFDQITILLNGVNISSPHTGHLSADFPVSPEDIERIEVLEGPAARVYGTSAFNGVINIVTRQTGNGAQVHLVGGQYGYAGGNASVGATFGTFHSQLSGGYTRCDGATPNSDFSSTRLFYQGNATIGSNVKVNGQVGYSYKPYAANTFYGASSTDQWESNERWMAAVGADIQLGRIHLSPQLYLNRWYDHYQWHKDNPAGENFHKVESKGASLNAWMESIWGRTSLGFEVRDERIRSTKLGKLLPEDEWQATGGHDGENDKFYKYRDQRANVSAFLEHDLLLKQWTVSLGLMANLNDGLDTKWRFYPGIDVSYRPTEAWKLFVSWNMGLRMPTFTDLYYSGANIEGNSELKPEKTTDYQIGGRYTTRGFIAEVQGFYSHKKNMIDWVTYNDANKVSDGIFHSVNFQMDNKGAEINLQMLPRQLWGDNALVRKIGVQYSYIYEESDYDVDVIMSKYAMDYLRHKVIVSADSKIWKNLNLSLSWRWQDREGKNNPAYALLDGRLSWDTAKWSAYIDGSNIFDKKYYDYVSIPQPGSWFRFGVRFSIN